RRQRAPERPQGRQSRSRGMVRLRLWPRRRAYRDAQARHQRHPHVLPERSSLLGAVLVKISLEWLHDFIELDLSPEELAKKLLMLGLEVTEIKALGPTFEGVVVGEILEVGKHPNADRLNLCSVKVGDEKLSIVCGAKNVAVGARVPVARIG